MRFCLLLLLACSTAIDAQNQALKSIRALLDDSGTTNRNRSALLRRAVPREEDATSDPVAQNPEGWNRVGAVGWTSVWASLVVTIAAFLLLSARADCLSFDQPTLVEVWKGGDDGLTNRLADALEIA